MMRLCRSEFKESVYSFSLWTFTVFLASVTWIPVQGQYHLIGSSQPIVASLGDDVVLPCHVEPVYNMQGLTVEWSNPDLKPDPSDRLSRVEYVHIYRHDLEVHQMMMSTYIGRTGLFVGELKRGNASLRIRNVTLDDTGNYRCFIPKLQTDTVVRLIVDPDLVTTWTDTPLISEDFLTPDPKNGTDVAHGGRSVLYMPLVIFLVVIVILTAFMVYHFKRRRHKETVLDDEATPSISPPA